MEFTVPQLIAVWLAGFLVGYITAVILGLDGDSR